MLSREIERTLFMLPDALLVYIALTVFVTGILYKVSTWLRYDIGPEAGEYSAVGRAGTVARDILRTLFSLRFFTLLKVFILDVIFQRTILRQSFFRWLAHMLIFAGFMLLLLFHALDKFTTSRLFANYYPTLNPFLFLRDLLGIVVLVGLAIAVHRRFLRKGPRPATNGRDVYGIAILAIILVSGVFLEGAKMVSHSAFDSMVEEYASQADAGERKDLETYWVKEFGLVSPQVSGPFDTGALERGRVSHEVNCMQCHSRPQWAFAGHAAAVVLKPAAIAADRAGLTVILFYIHFLSCLFGLAYLPFSKMFHIFATPLSLLVNGVMRDDGSLTPKRLNPAGVAVKQAMELDACTHCGSCSAECAVAAAYSVIPNSIILPSEKIPAIRLLASGKDLSIRHIGTIQQGMHLCTNCRRCDAICPSGIHLTAIWSGARESLLRKSVPEFLLLSPFSVPRGLMRESMDLVLYERPLDVAREGVAAVWDAEKVRNRAMALAPGFESALLGKGGPLKQSTFSNCFRCMTCSSACPVVRNYQDPVSVLGLLPHQIMHAVGLRLWDLVFSSKMLWDCLGCYQCQENCPQCVNVADVIYELKNVAISRALQPIFSKLEGD